MHQVGLERILGRPHGRAGSTSLSVISPASGSRAPTRCYIQPEFGRLRCKHGRSWASATTRYLQWCLRRDQERIPLSWLFFDFLSWVNAVKLHVPAADVLVTEGIPGRASDNNCSARRPERGRYNSRRTQIWMIGAAVGAGSRAARVLLGVGAAWGQSRATGIVRAWPASQSPDWVMAAC